MADILKQAAAAAAKVKTGWGAFFSDVLKVVEVVVIVVVAIAIVALITVLTDGLGDALLGPEMGFLVDGAVEAVAGGVSNMVQTVLSNVWINHSGWSGGVFTALWQGAAAGALSFGLSEGAEALVASKAGAKGALAAVKGALEDGGADGLKGFAIRGGFELGVGTVASVFQQLVLEGELWNGQWSWSEFALNLATNAAGSAATSHGQFEDLTEHVQDKVYGKRLKAYEPKHAAPEHEPEHAKPKGGGPDHERDSDHEAKHAKPEHEPRHAKSDDEPQHDERS